MALREAWLSYVWRRKKFINSMKNGVHGIVIRGFILMVSHVSAEMAALWMATEF